MSPFAPSGRRGPGRRAHARRRLSGATGRDDAAGPILQFIAAAAVFAFVLALVAVYTNDYSTSTTSQVDDLDHAAVAAGALSLLIDNAGYPLDWGDSDAFAEGLARLGLRAESDSRRLDQAKLMRFQGAGLDAADNGKVDYAEARAALGLQEHQFHLRTSPVFDPFEDGYFGIVGMDDKRIGYVGDYETDGVTERPPSVQESSVIDDLPLLFENRRFDPSAPHLGGDKLADRKQTLETYLPLRLAGWRHTEAGSGDPGAIGSYTWRVYNASDLKGVPAPAGDRVVAVGSTSGPRYAAGDDDRLVTKPLDLTGMAAPRLVIVEYVDGACTTVGSACLAPDDHGTVEVSRSGTPGTWFDVTPTTHVWTSNGAWQTRVVDLSACVPCRSGPVHVGFRWQASDGDGAGWLIDEARVEDAASGQVAWRTDSTLGRSYYEVLIIGSEVDQNAMTPASIKYLLRDWVLAGGNLYVLGSTAQSDEWMQPIFGAGLGSGGNQPPYAPDPSHPILTTPNELAYASYPRDDGVWRMGPPWQDKFYQVIGTPPPSKTNDRDDVLGISAPGAYGDGTVILTTFLGYQMEEDEFTKLLANFLMYGRYGVLYLDYGLPIPEGRAVGIAERLTLAPLTIDPVGPKLEMRVIIQVWRG